MFSVPTTRYEQFLLFALLAIVIPFEIQLSISKTIGIAWVYFCVLAMYVLTFRLNIFMRVVCHPLVFWLGFFLVSIFILESIMPLSNYDDHKQLIQVLFGAVLVSCLARDENGTRAMIWGAIFGGICLGSLFVASSYATLAAFSNINPHLASEARKFAFAKLGIKGNTNFMALYIGQAFFSGLILLLYRNNSKLKKAVLISICVLTGFGVATSMSRGAVLCTMTASLLVLVLLKKINIRTVLYISIIATAVTPLLPKVLYERYTNIDTNVGSARAEDARKILYRAAYSSVSDYLWFGIGAGNFWNNWGFKNGFSLLQHEGKGVIGAHNSFLQTLINWGIFSVIILFIAVVAMGIMAFNLPPSLTSIFIKAYGLTVIISLLTTTGMHMKIVSVFIGSLLGNYLKTRDQIESVNRLNIISSESNLKTSV